MAKTINISESSVKEFKFVSMQSSDRITLLQWISSGWIQIIKQPNAVIPQ